MNFLQAGILGLIQGIAEWLPISSEAMVALGGKFLFGMGLKTALQNAIWLHLGTFFSALIYFRKDIMTIFENKPLLIFLTIATLLTGVVGIPLMFVLFKINIPDSIITILIGILLVFVAVLNKKRKEGKSKELTIKKAAGVGLAQGLAILPGFSRSGLTIATLLAEDFPLKDAFKLSFLMSLPATFGVQLFLPLFGSGFEINLPLIFGGFIATIVGLATIDFLMKLAKNSKFYKSTLILGITTIFLGILLI